MLCKKCGTKLESVEIEGSIVTKRFHIFCTNLARPVIIHALNGNEHLVFQIQLVRKYKNISTILRKIHYKYFPEHL